jgi:hypothetical protein
LPREVDTSAPAAAHNPFVFIQAAVALVLRSSSRVRPMNRLRRSER